MTEDWKVIKDYPNYSVSNLGRVRNNKTGRYLTPHKCGHLRTYYQVAFYTGDPHSLHKHVLLHRLVAKAFIPNPESKPEVNHIDGNGFNNCVSNLEWSTHSENLLHSYNELGRKRCSGADNGHSKRVIRVEDGQVFDTVIEAAQACGSNAHSGISHCLSGRRQIAFGYHWKYYEG